MVAKLRKGPLECHGNQTTMNLNVVLHRAIMESRYFKNELYEFTTFNQVVDEIYRACTDLEPFMAGTYGSTNTPSSAFCLLYKLFLMKCTGKQMMALLNHPDSPYIRGIGFLYLRYTCPPKQLMSWYSDFLDDDEPIKIGWAQDAPEITIGKFVKQLLTQTKYFNTLFPRIPVPIARDIEKQLKGEKLVEANTLSDKSSSDHGSKNGNSGSRNNNNNSVKKNDNKNDDNSDDNQDMSSAYWQFVKARRNEEKSIERTRGSSHQRDSRSPDRGSRDESRERCRHSDKDRVSDQSSGNARPRSERDRDRDRNRDRDRSRERTRPRHSDRDSDRSIERSKSYSERDRYRHSDRDRR